MAYPYVNGTPHLGHAFTVTKVEFASRVARAQGKRTLYPQGYHVTGMPIKACADKLVNEIRMFGKDLEGYSEEAEEAAPTPAPTSTETKADITKFTNVKKGKAALKTVKSKYQFQVMLSMAAVDKPPLRNELRSIGKYRLVRMGNDSRHPDGISGRNGMSYFDGTWTSRRVPVSLIN